jgi:hypothetical protein
VWQQRSDETDFVKRMLLAIRAELDALRQGYDRSVGSTLAQLKEGERFTVRLGMSLQYFTVFESNGVHLGRLDSELSVRIIRLFAGLKSLVDNFRINNDYIVEHAACMLRMKQFRDQLARCHPGLLDPESRLVRRG